MTLDDVDVRDLTLESLRERDELGDDPAAALAPRSAELRARSARVAPEKAEGKG